MPDGVLAKGCAGATVVDYWGHLSLVLGCEHLGDRRNLYIPVSMSSGGNGIVDMYHSFGSLAFVAIHRFENPVGDLLGRDLTGGAVELATRGYDFPAHLVEANS